MESGLQLSKMLESLEKTTLRHVEMFSCKHWFPIFTTVYASSTICETLRFPFVYINEYEQWIYAFIQHIWRAYITYSSTLLCVSCVVRYVMHTYLLLLAISFYCYCNDYIYSCSTYKNACLCLSTCSSIYRVRTRNKWKLKFSPELRKAARVSWGNKRKIFYFYATNHFHFSSETSSETIATVTDEWAYFLVNIAYFLDNENSRNLSVKDHDIQSLAEMLFTVS